MDDAAQHLVVLDFEATCDRDGDLDPVEIIEFPSILYSVADDTVVDEFTSFVRPVAHPRLTDFCRELTGIEQRDVAGARPFPAVFADHQRWLGDHGFDVERDDQFVFVTCGDWDLRSMLPQQVQLVDPGRRPPPAYRSWINVKQILKGPYGADAVATLPAMLDNFGLSLVGRHHRGIDDCRNILAVLRALLAAGHHLAPTGGRGAGSAGASGTNWIEPSTRP